MTTPPRELSAQEILETAQSIVGSARESVLATMNAADEIERPLPRGYFLLLIKKLSEGVHIKRVVFGTEAQASLLGESIDIKDSNYEYRLAPPEGYKRMLLVDESKLMFAIPENGSNRFFYTEDTALIKEYKDYFYSHFGA